jgi:SAM-dependent methyltransferase
MLTRSIASAWRQNHLGAARRNLPIKSFQQATMSNSRISTSQSNDSVWKLQNVEAAYWNDYIVTRPKYDATIFDPIFGYHTAKTTPFRDVLDIGTGAGSALGPLTDRFKRVTASDNDTISLGFAQERFRHVARNRLSWIISSGEDLVAHHARSSFDMITCALTFPLLDTTKALSSMYTLLRPGGTLAIWFYGPPFFLDPTLATNGQPILYAAVDQFFRPVVSGGDAQRSATWKRAADGMASWLDYIPFSTDDWQDVRRQKWNNAHARLAFFGPAACDFQIEPMSAVGEKENITQKQDSNFWRVNWDFEMLSKFILSVFPRPIEVGGRDEVLDGHLEKLRDIMGGKGVKASMSWPAVLILAQKRD